MDLKWTLRLGQIMKSIFKTHLLFASLVLVFLEPPSLGAQIIDEQHINTLIEDGNTDKAITNLKYFLGNKVEVSIDDSSYALKTLGMLYTQNSNLDTAKMFFKALLRIDPTASIKNTDASYTIIEVFTNAKNEFKKDHGGVILRPKVIVMDPLGTAIEDKYRSSIARQFIEELQRLWLFEAINWDNIQQKLKADKLDPSTCKTDDCYLNMAKSIEGDKLILLKFEQVDNVYTLVLKYIDVHSKKVESLLKRASVNNLDTLI